MKRKHSPNNIVFWFSSFFITILVIWGAILPDSFAEVATTIYDFTTHAFGWFYLVSVLGIVFFCMFLAISRFGRIRLGGDDSKPDYPFFTWIGMLFSAGFGVGLVFWGVAEPMQHFLITPTDTDPLTAEAARDAMRYAFFNWGIHQWSVFTIVGLALSYFQYRKRTTGLISSTLNPILGEGKKSGIRIPIDTLAVIATVMGVATSLGMGIMQINGGLHYVFALPNGTGTQLIITAILLVLYLVSSTTGLDRGIKILSNLNLGLALALMLFFLFLGPTVFILNSLTLGIGDYLQHFLGMSLHLTPYEGGTWVQDWTIFYWAWVIAWSPFVGSFIARVSKGRTIREFIFGVLIVPPALAMIWMSVFGGSALHLDLFQGTDIAQAVNNNVTSALFTTFDHFPFTMVLSVLAILLIFTFLITSADSATFVLGIMTTNGDLNPSMFVKIIWGILQAAIAAVLIISSGLQGLQTASLISALPFTLILLMMCFALFKSLSKEPRQKRKKEPRVKKEKS
ncbi:choline/carnitine/betaine transport [Salinibacillus kushneri]|uniref:Choline/carnitine/betaine transport n=1 Tax=Salinibacillus kushneri TaxID=237682 RepID=A0A1I0DNL6_9BACI|nr:BCCT family transporter [Salinibacillus kushneri]SET34108.1 choline/carnitine/betaine transport [Salinibacillus kushneri]